MSEQLIRRDSRANLLVTVSAVALLAYSFGMGDVRAADDDADGPPLWIELGGQLSELNDAQQPTPLPFVPSFAAGRSPLSAQKPPRFGFDEEAGITYQPEDSDWVISGGVRFGRASVTRHQHIQTGNKAVYAAPFTIYGFKLGGISYYPSQHVKFADTVSSQNETHSIIDFQIGKDVGIGMFGSSVLSGGLRFAQFTSKSAVTMHAEPDVQYPDPGIITNFAGKYQFHNAHVRFHDYAQTASRNENFRGFGPKIDWKASTPIAGTSNTTLAIDWGANFSLLFGRQKMSERHRTKIQSYYLTNMQFGFEKTGKVHPVVFENSALACGALPVHCPATAQHTNVGGASRMRSVLVPDFGGFAGISFRYASAKVSFGYRADFFLDAMDGGIATRKEENVGFQGPFATISMGLGG